MRQTVYIDILFLLNLFINYFILLMNRKINRVNTPVWRLFLAACLGAACSLFIFIPNMPQILSFFCNLVIAASVVLAAFGFGCLKRFLRLAGSFYLISFLFAGFMMGIWLIFRPNGMVVNNGIVYFNISPFFLLLGTLAVYFILSLVRRLFGAVKREKELYEIEIALDTSCVSMTALVDTGNTLKDVFSDMPVIVTEYQSIRSILPAGAEAAFQKQHLGIVPVQMKNKYRLVPFSSIGGKGMLPAFRADRVSIKQGTKMKKVDRCLVAVSEDNFGGAYHALIGDDLFQEGNG